MSASPEVTSHPNHQEQPPIDPLLQKMLMHAVGVNPALMGQDTMEMLAGDTTTAAPNQQQAEEQARAQIEAADEQVMRGVAEHGPADQTRAEEAARVEADKSVVDAVEHAKETVGVEKAEELSREAMAEAAEQVHPEEHHEPGAELEEAHKHVTEAFHYDSTNGNTELLVERAARETAAELERAGVKTNAKEVLEDMKPMLHKHSGDHIDTRTLEHVEDDVIGERAVDALANNKRITPRLVEDIKDMDPAAQQRLAQVIAFDREGRGVTERSAREVGHDLRHAA